MQLVKSPSRGGGISKKGSKNNFNYFNGMKIKSSVPSTPIEKELREELQEVKGKTKMIALKKISPRA